METLEPTNVEGQVNNVVADELDGGNLPSAQEGKQLDLDRFSFQDDFVEKNFKNGKLYGRFDSIDAVLNTLREVETKHSNTMRDIKSGKYQEVDANAVKQQQLTETVNTLVPEFIQAGMELTPEIEAKATEAGIDIRDLKLGAIEVKETLTKVYNLVGGQEEYQAMIEWGRNNLDEKQQKEFDIGVKSTLSSYAVKGLYAEYQQAIANGEPQTKERLYGDATSSSSVKPYGSMSEILRDRAYVSGAGRNDQPAIELHKRRMNMTPDSVFSSRA